MALVPFDPEKEVTSEVKVVMLGAKRVGKSSIIQKFCEGSFQKMYDATIGVDYNSNLMEVDGKLVNVNILDTSGDENFLWALSNDLQDADGFAFVYDITNEESLIALSRWLKIVKKYQKSSTIPKLLLGNKSDLRHKQVISSAEAKEFGIPEGMVHFEVSANLERNLNAAFYVLAAEALRWRSLGCVKVMGESFKYPFLEYQPEYEEDKNGVKLNKEGPEYTHVFKILLVGGPRSGKTCLRFRFCRDHFTPEYHPTSGFECSTRTLVIEGDRIKIQVWDIAGIDLYDQMRKGYYKGANGFIIAYDISSKTSFAQAERFLKELSMLAPDDSPKVMIGTKCDATQKRQISFCVAKEFADGWRLPVIEVSAKTGENVDVGMMKCILALKRQLAPWKRVYNFS